MGAILNKAIKDGVVSRSDRRLIVETRVFDYSINEIAARHDINASALRRRRERAEAALRGADLTLPM